MFSLKPFDFLPITSTQPSHIHLIPSSISPPPSPAAQFQLLMSPTITVQETNQQISQEANNFTAAQNRLQLTLTRDSSLISLFVKEKGCRECRRRRKRV
jgi:hypothetical protein